ncbi:PAS domain-containing protein [Sphaerisporangium sp. B11E5]|uniref:helix-turn-helix transcriptional regulator n=1 Tax=Sphaerisporangium sp. B11E5 TaxID=3153563 RepID=UPI00325DED66
MLRDEGPPWWEPFVPVCEAVAVLLAPQGEVAVHDLGTERIVALWNPLSGRRVGDDSLIEELPEDPSAGRVIGPYEKVLPDGRRCTSVSAVLSDEAGKPRGLLCVNFDRSGLDQIAALAGTLLAARVERPGGLTDKDWREQIALRVHEFCRERGVRRDRLDREARRELIARLDGEGLFAVRRAADLAAEALGVSRATVYALLKETRS